LPDQRVSCLVEPLASSETLRAIIVQLNERVLRPPANLGFLRLSECQFHFPLQGPPICFIFVQRNHAALGFRTFGVDQCYAPRGVVSILRAVNQLMKDDAREPGEVLCKRQRPDLDIPTNIASGLVQFFGINQTLGGVIFTETLGRNHVIDHGLTVGRVGAFRECGDTVQTLVTRKITRIERDLGGGVRHENQYNSQVDRSLLSWESMLLFSPWRAALTLVLAMPSMAQSIHPITDRHDWISSPALSPDGTALAVEWAKSDSSLGIFVRPFGGGQFRPFAGRDSKDGSPTHPRWSPDGNKIAFLRSYCHHCDHQLFVRSYPRGAERRLGAVCGSPASWTPDGRYLIAVEPNGTVDEECRVVLIPVDGGSRVILSNKGDVVALSPDGKKLAYAVGNELKLVSLTTDFRISGTPVTVTREPHAISTINWVPDGRAFIYQVWSDGNPYTRFVSTEGVLSRGHLINLGAKINISQVLTDGRALGTETDGRSALWRVDLKAARQEPERVRGIEWTDHLLSVSPDGQSLAFATNRNAPTQIWVSRFDGSNPRVLVSAIPPFNEFGDWTAIDGISWSPNGEWIALRTQPGIGHGNDDARLFVVPSTGGRLRVLAELCSQGDGAPSWSTDSRSVFFSRDDEKDRASLFQVEISSGRQSVDPGDRLPSARDALVSSPSGARQPHMAQDGRFLYFQKSEREKRRIVLIRNLLPMPGQLDNNPRPIF